MRCFLSPLFAVYHWLWAFAGALFCGFPSRKFFVIGVTGTKGKSTTAELIAAILSAAGKKTAFFSSVRTAIGDEREKNLSGNSMPGRGALQRFLRRAARAGCTHAVAEVTSEGVAQYRHRFIDWDAAVFLNLAPEHIERHGSFEKYRAAKVAFFASLAHSAKPERWFFVNAGDPNSTSFVEAAEKISGAHIVKFAGAPAVKNPWLASDFNRENAAAALAVADALKIAKEVAMGALERFEGVPGRLEYVRREPFAVVVDYAHTPDSLEKIYQYLKSRQLKVDGQKLICVLGSAGGGRDRWKRPEMGKIAARYCDEIILTNEDPYDENPAAILDEIEKGIRINQPNPHKSALKILDRKEAIKRAISSAKENDTVIMTGKGSEPWIHGASGKKAAWDERHEIEEALQSKG
ncbi:MAG: Mur ligase family protein [Candidatus Jorgensenbacteria bacterium]